MTLKPCPYCKSEDVECANICGHAHQVVCNNCGATGPSHATKHKVGDLWSDQLARKSWNAGKQVQS